MWSDSLYWLVSSWGRHKEGVLNTRDDVYKYGVGNVKLYHGIAMLLLVMYMLQLLTGFIMVSFVTTNLDLAFMQLYYVATSGWYVWIVRDLHMLGANLSMILLYLHVVKATSCDMLTLPRVSIWLSGTTILVLSLGVCFTGYILVTGQMSYWALIVILNLATVLPVADELIVNTFLAGSHPTSWSISRVLSLHFLLSLVVIGMVFLHLNFIHRARPSTSSAVGDSSQTLGDVAIKDLVLLAPTV